MKRFLTILILIVALAIGAHAQSGAFGVSTTKGPLIATVGGGIIQYQGVEYTVNGQDITLPINTTTYILYDNGAITTNTSGFTSTCIPIAVVITDNSRITTIQDKHPSYIVTAPTAASIANTLTIYAQTYTPFAGQVIWTCSWSSGSPTITCPANTFTSAVVGYQAFATTLGPQGGQSEKGSQLACGSNSGATTILTFTDSAHVNLSRNCTQNSGANNPFFFGPDETTGVTNFSNAVSNACATGLLPNGFALIKSAEFINAPATACANNIGATRQSPMLIGQGPGQSQFIIAPDFNWTTCTGGGAQKYCFFGGTVASNGGGYSASYLGFDGLGSNYSAGTGGAVIMGMMANTFLDHVNVQDIGPTETSFAAGLSATNYPIDLNFVQFDGSGGSIACRIGTAVGPVSIESSYCGGVTGSNTRGGALDIIGSIVSRGNVYGPVWGNSNYVVSTDFGCTAGTFYSSQDQYLDNGGGTTDTYIGNNCNNVPMFISHGMVLPQANSDTAIGMYLSGASIHLDHTLVKVTGTGANAYNIVAGASIFDDCGNTFVTVAANVLSGNVTNCPTEPSLGGRCLLTSQAGPLACGFSSTGKVAIPTTTATYTINTVAVQSGSTITITPTTDNTGIPGPPTCVLPTNTAIPSISATSPGASFTIAETSTTGITCFEWTIR